VRDASSSPSVATRVPAAACVFAVFCFVLALIAVAAFWPPKTLDVIVWLVAWVGLCLATGVAILRRQSYAVTLVWTILIVALLSAGLAMQSGLLDMTGILIDIVLFVPMIWFAIWYHRHRRSTR
jgi:hypothetical protein